MAVVGTLLVNLAAKTAVFDRNLKRSGKNLSAFEKAAWKAANRITQLSKTMVGLSWKALKVGFNGLVAILKKAVQGLAALGAALSYCVYEAALAEEAEIKLERALKNSGQYTEDNFMAMKNYAKYLQSITRSGDEANMELMQLGLSMGLTAKQSMMAAKGALGFQDAFGMDTTAGMKNITLAMKGQYTMLGRYIPAIRTATTAAGKNAIFQKAMADSFEISKVNAQKGLGPLVRMKNALGEIAETIGGPFLDNMQRSADAVRTWAERNQGRIGAFAARVDGWLTALGKSFVNWLGDESRQKKLTEFVRGLSDWFKELFNNIQGWIEAHGGLAGIWDSISNTVSNVYNWIVDMVAKIQGMADKITGMVDYVKNSALGKMAGFATKINPVYQVIKNRQAIGSAIGTVGHYVGKGINSLGEASNLTEHGNSLQRQGLIAGSNKDIVEVLKRIDQRIAEGNRRPVGALGG
jgi:hypothetical protein